MSISRGFQIFLCCGGLFAATLSLSEPARAAEIQSVVRARPQADAAAVGRFVYGVTLTGVGFGLIPWTTEAIIDGRLDPDLSAGYWGSALVLGIGGIPMMASLRASLGNGSDPLSGPRARVKMARNGVLPYATFGSLFSALSIVLTGLAVSEDGSIPMGVHVFNASSMTLLGTAVALAIDGDLARWQLPPGERRTSVLVDLGIPTLISGILLLVAATPAMRLGLYKDGKSLDASYVPMAGGIGFTGVGVISLVLQQAIKQQALRGGRGGGGQGPTVTITPTLGGVGIQGRF
jgi:hypothetical protein